MQDYNITCDGCKKEFLLSTIDIEESPIEIDGAMLQVRYFKCPKCNKVYRIGIMDTKYYNLKKDLDQAKARLRFALPKDKVFVEGLAGAIQRKQKRLGDYEQKLLNKYSGTFTLLASENNEQERLQYLP